MLRISHLSVAGFRSLANIADLNLGSFAILIGRNNSGKSNILAAMNLLLTASKADVSPSDFHSQGSVQSPEMTLEATIEGVEDYLPLCADQHRTKIAGCLESGALRVRRKIRREPLTIGNLEIWQADRSAFGLPTGIESALKQILPEVIFIEAFKDPSAEAQAKSTATLGKLLKQIMEQVTLQVKPDVVKALESADRLFNVSESDGKLQDGRPDELKRIEQRIRRHVQSVFEGSDVRLRFELPDVSDLMGTATVDLRDSGPWTPPELKGQGFQRILYMSLLQALAEESRESRGGTLHRPFILLAEEPEAFLHPVLQREMGDTLARVAQDNQVVIATHSPLMVTPQRIQDVTIVRQSAAAGTQMVSTTCCGCDPDQPLDPEDKQLAALLRFSSSSEFLFADRVLVVEGPSDRSLLEAVWAIANQTLKVASARLVLAIVEAGSKAVVPVWISHLEAMGIHACGLVDLDFLWNGAGKCLHADSDLSRFTQEFWNTAGAKGLVETEDGQTSIVKGKKKDAFSVVVTEFAGVAQVLRERLREKSRIWVLHDGEIETYFGLAASSKGDYSAASQRVRKNEIPIHQEILDILQWSTG